MKTKKIAAATLTLSLMISAAALAQDAMVKGVVKKIDAGAGKITLTSGPIKSLDMNDDNMTMVFRVQGHSVISLTTSDWIATHDLVSDRINHSENVLVLQVDVKLPRHGVVVVAAVVVAFESRPTVRVTLEPGFSWVPPTGDSLRTRPSRLPMTRTFTWCP